MSRLLDPAELEHAAKLVSREAAVLLHRAQEEHERIDRARATGNDVAERAALHRLARIARQLTRAQAVLVHPDDGRHRAAQAVIGYCDEADSGNPWSPVVVAPPVTLGVGA